MVKIVYLIGLLINLLTINNETNIFLTDLLFKKEFCLWKIINLSEN